MQKSFYSIKNRWIKMLSFSFIIFYLSFSEAQAQVRIGVKGGFQLANMEFNNDDLKKSNRVGFFVGPIVKIGLPVTGLAIDAAALYDQRDLKVQEETFKQQSLILQGNARYGVGLGDVLGLFLTAGPQFSFNMGDDVMHWFGSDGELKYFTLQETMLSVNFGLGVTFANHLEGSVNYNIPVSKTADFTWQQFGDEIWGQTWNHAKTRTNIWHLSVVYYF